MKRTICLLLVLLALFCSCGRGADALSGAGGEGDGGGEGSRIPNTAYQAEEFPLPDGEVMETFVFPQWDGETLRYMSVRRVLTGKRSADGYMIYDRAWSLVEATRTEVLAQIPLDLPKGAVTPGMIRDGELVAAVQNWSDRFLDIHLLRVRASDGETQISESLLQYFGEDDIVRSMAVDGNGLLYLASDTRIFVFGEDFAHRATIDTGCRDFRVAACADGSVIGSDHYRVFRIDSDSLTLAQEIPLKARSILEGAHGFDFCVMRNGDIWGVRADWQTGTTEEELLFDYDASDLSGWDLKLLCTAGDFGFLYEREEMLTNSVAYYPVLCTPAPEIDLSEMTILKVATTALPSDVINAAVSEFNRTHADIRIEVEEYRGGELASEDERLAREIVTGTFIPDVVIGSSESVSVRQMAEMKLYADLKPYIASDSLVREDNLFGAVKRMFDDGQGGMWGITTNLLLLRTLVSTPSLIGEAASKGYWTLPEFLDYAENLPSDMELLHNLTRDDAAELLFGADGYGYFIDSENGTCSFDSPDFIRYLRFISSLPTEEEYRRTEWGMLDDDGIAERRMNGKIALGRIQPDIIGHNGVLVCGTKDWTLIGYPAAEKRTGAGTAVSTGTVFILSAACQNKDAAWEFIRACFSDREANGGSPALKSLFYSMAENYYDKEFLNFFTPHPDTGYEMIRDRDHDHPTAAEDLPYPGIVSDYTPADAAKMEAILDSLGRPLLAAWRTDVEEIVREELSAYLAGVGSPEDCAKKIQSRVSIWLAEHK